MKERRNFILLLSLLTLFISVSITLTSPEIIGLNPKTLAFPQIDTIAHFVSFFILSWVMHTLIKLPLPLTVITLIFYGALSELGQLYLGFRNGEISDFFADTAGIIFFALCKYIYTCIFKRNKISKKD